MITDEVLVESRSHTVIRTLPCETEMILSPEARRQGISVSQGARTSEVILAAPEKFSMPDNLFILLTMGAFKCYKLETKTCFEIYEASFGS